MDKNPARFLPDFDHWKLARSWNKLPLVLSFLMWQLKLRGWAALPTWHRRTRWRYRGCVRLGPRRPEQLTKTEARACDLWTIEFLCGLPRLRSGFRRVASTVYQLALRDEMFPRKARAGLGRLRCLSPCGLPF